MKMMKRRLRIVSALSLCFIMSVALMSCMGAGTVPVTLTSIAVTPDPATIATGNTVQFTAKGTYSDASTAVITTQVSWDSSATAIATVDSSTTPGLATGVAAGTVTITATSDTIKGTAQLIVTQ
jgi:uncharacterized protein YjdB